MSAYSDKVIADGAVAYWRLGEASGTTANDSVGSAHGVISGGVTLGQSGALAGDSDKAMLFDGTTGKVVTSSRVLPVPMTIEVWIKTTSLGAYRPIVAGDGNTVFLGLTDTGKISIYTDGTSIIESVATVTNGQFHHIVYLSTGTQATLYIDGIKDTGPNAETRTALTGPIGIGFRQFNNTYFSGTIDDVAIYPTALTAVQIAAHYNLGRTNFPAGSYPAKVVSDGCSAYWRLGETSGTTAVDVIGGANGTISGGVTLGQAGALADGDKAMAFDVDGRVVAPTGAYQSFGTGPITLECWLNLAALSSGGTKYLVDCRNATAGAGIQLYYHATAILCLASDGSVNTSRSTVPPLGQWNHVAGVVSRGATDYLTLFLNGVQVTQIAFTTAGTNLGSTLGTGIGGPSAFNNNFTSGLLDDVAIYKTALTPAQIAAHYALSKYKAGSYPSLVIMDGASAYWRLGELAGTVANDEIGTADGTISGGVTLAQPGALADGDKAMAFDGSTGKIQTVGNLSVPVICTIEGWVRDPVAQFFSTRNLPGATGNTVAVGVNVFVNVYVDGTYIIGVKTVTAGSWHYIACVMNGSTAIIYVDGVLDSSHSLARTLPSGGPATIGWDTGVAAFAGLVDDVAIYPTALTAPQIAAHYAAREFSEANLPTVPWPVVAGLAWSQFMDSYNKAAAITPSDTVDLAEVTDAIMVGGAGNVAVVMQNGAVVTFKSMPSGAWIPVAARRVNATGTTALDLVGLYQI